MMQTIYLSIGSNLGDRRGFISKAVEALHSLGKVRVSEEYVSEANGFESSNSFINIAAELTIDSDELWNEDKAITLLHRLKAIENALSGVPHRNADGSYRDREIDIDIIAIEGLRINSAELILPHPRAATRNFVMTPLAELISMRKIRELLLL